ncbi:MAG TPA: hypothetical protein VKR21_03935 [Solirubrobacteraceae bacterium]|nr:hypothetical protein [Solirubrobacteraceae bacterium]
MNDEAPEALRRLEDRLAQASDAAERLIAEAARAAARERPPAAGWQTVGDDDPSARRPGELEALLAGLQALRGAVPPEVLKRLLAALRELLLALRALIDVYLERLERPPPSADEVRDIPID